MTYLQETVLLSSLTLALEQGTNEHPHNSGGLILQETQHSHLLEASTKSRSTGVFDSLNKISGTISGFKETKSANCSGLIYSLFKRKIIQLHP